MDAGNNCSGVFWDYENCRSTNGLTGYSLADRIRQIATRYGMVAIFKAYADFSLDISTKAVQMRSELQCSGVSLTDCPHNGRKDVADKMILVDMMTFAIDNPAPATVVIISNDRDMAYAAAVLRLRRYRVVLLSKKNATHDSLKSQASAVHDWNEEVLRPSPAEAARASISTAPQSPVPVAETTPTKSGNGSIGIRRITVFSDGLDHATPKWHRSDPAIDLQLPGQPSDEGQHQSTSNNVAHFNNTNYEQLGPVETEAISHAQPTVTITPASTGPTSLPSADALNISPDSNSATTAVPSIHDAAEGLSLSPPHGSSQRHCRSEPSFSRPATPHGELDHTEVTTLAHDEEARPEDFSEYESAPSSPQPSSPMEPNFPGSLPLDEAPYFADFTSEVALHDDTPSSEHACSPIAAAGHASASLRPLVDHLDRLREEGCTRPLRSTVALDLLIKERDILRRTGAQSFAEYFVAALEAEVVELSDVGGKACIYLHPAWKQRRREALGGPNLASRDVSDDNAIELQRLQKPGHNGQGIPRVLHVSPSPRKTIKRRYSCPAIMATSSKLPPVLRAAPVAQMPKAPVQPALEAYPNPVRAAVSDVVHARPNILGAFQPLAEALEIRRLQGEAKCRKKIIMKIVSKQNEGNRLFGMVGPTEFYDYAKKAKEAGVILSGTHPKGERGPKGKWVSLHPRWHGRVNTQ